ncbi:MAG: hypothetical protein ACRYFA_04325 [Janthinobacterium lividum]
MKKYNLKMLALGLIATLAFASCEVQQNRYSSRRPDHHHRGRDHRDDHDRHDNRNSDNRY